VDTKELAAILGIILSVSTIIYVGLKMRLQADFDYRYMTVKSCEEKHKVTDTLFGAMREDLKEIKDALKTIQDIMFQWVGRGGKQ
jgi:5-bromo-4-chloroindolyl phosphate hydrolysis protein